MTIRLMYGNYFKCKKRKHWKDTNFFILFYYLTYNYKTHTFEVKTQVKTNWSDSKSVSAYNINHTVTIVRLKMRLFNIDTNNTSYFHNLCLQRYLCLLSEIQFRSDRRLSYWCSFIYPRPCFSCIYKFISFEYINVHIWD